MQAKSDSFKAQLQEELKETLMETQDSISSSLEIEQNQEILFLKQAHQEEINSLKESCSYQLDEQSNKHALIQAPL